MMLPGLETWRSWRNQGGEGQEGERQRNSLLRCLEARLSWCGHVQRRDRRMLRMALPGRRSRATPETGEDVKEAGVDISSDQATRSAFVESQKCSAGSDLKSSCLQPHSCCVLSHIHDEAPPSLSGAPIRWAETQRQERSE